MFSAFLPAAGKDALNRMSGEVRAWRIQLRSGTGPEDIAARINPIVRPEFGQLTAWCTIRLLGRSG